MNIVKIQNASVEFFKMSLSKDNIFIGRALVKNSDGNFPLVCFNSFTLKFSHIKPGDVIDVEGCFKDYSYKDYNGVTHFVKLVIVTGLSINGTYDVASMEEKNEFEEIWKKIKKTYRVLDIIEFERFSNMEEEPEECCQ